MEIVSRIKASASRTGFVRAVPGYALVALMALVAVAGWQASRACITCDSGHKCHAGDEQGGFLCRSGEVHCSVIKQLLGFECGGSFCETDAPCDNRPKSGITPTTGLDLQGGRCGPAPAEPPAALVTPDTMVP